MRDCNLGREVDQQVDVFTFAVELDQSVADRTDDVLTQQPIAIAAALARIDCEDRRLEVVREDAEVSNQLVLVDATFRNLVLF